MNFLQMAQAVLQETGVSGTGPAAVTGLKGIEARIVTWVMRAWLEIQEERQDWLFQYKAHSFNLSPDKATYSLTELSITDLDRWDFGTATIYPTADPTAWRELRSDLTYDDWRRRLSLSSEPASQTNYVMTIPGTFNDLMFWPVPDQEYTVNLVYYRAPTVLAANTDTPILAPSNLHWAIVWRALMDYAVYDGAPEIDNKAREEWARYKSMIEARYKPSPSLCLGDVTLG